MALSDTEAQRLQRDVENLRHTVYGNGREGLDEMIRRNTTAIAAIQSAGARVDTKLDDLKSSIDALRQERRDDQKKREGRVELAGWVKYVLAVLGIVVGIGTPLGLWRVSTQWAEVQQQIQRIPAVPE